MVYLQMGGNAQFRMMQENGFLYDASMPTLQNNPSLWPYTLDYLSTQVNIYLLIVTTVLGLIGCHLRWAVEVTEMS